MCFIEQEKKLRIYNIDTPDTVQYSHGELFPNMIRSLVLGSSGCGKTNLIYFLLVDENGIIDGIDGINIFTFFENDKVIAPEKVLPNSIFIMDDVIGEQQGIREYFFKGRHNKVDIFYLAQSYSKVLKQLIRDNANLIVLFKQDETNLKHVYNEHFSGDMTYNQFKQFCTVCWNRDRFEFIFICKDSERDSGRYRFRFDTHEESNILEELVKAKESIKRKYTALKNGEADVQQLVAQTFKPVIEPLTKISNTHDLYTNQSSMDKGGNKLGGIDYEINEIDDVDNDDYYQQEIENWFQSVDIDKTYDPK
ncbi:tigger transposable element-derived protein 4-like [Aphis craccivora]|uniref:Tigger transposable element-derived protein 4-like n=1 Tax=Aphis craccivora TaxID=307492 RepID=A0A6G0VPT4_APHCR|nr:tigger transposable element-derived protein 4-like [Aphis craccivora]